MIVGYYAFPKFFLRHAIILPVVRSMNREHTASPSLAKVGIPHVKGGHAVSA
jgi:hypothetical protein